MIRPSISKLAAVCLAVGIGLMPALARAERADRDKPMNIESDALRYDDKTQTSTFTGRVVLTKGTIVMRGARLDVRQDDQGNQFGTMQAEPGKRAFFRQKREGLNEFIEGEGETIEIASDFGEIAAIAHTDESLRPGTVSISFGFGQLHFFHHPVHAAAAANSGRCSSDAASPPDKPL